MIIIEKVIVYLHNSMDLLHMLNKSVLMLRMILREWVKKKIVLWLGNLNISNKEKYLVIPLKS
jgi:hypothetical protein